jgi:general stress protein 26
MNDLTASPARAATAAAPVSMLPPLDTPAGPPPHEAPPPDDFRAALERAQDIRFAMAWAAGAPELPCPLTTQQLDAEGRLWFFVADDGALTHAVREAGRLWLTYADPSAQRYVSLVGPAAVAQDAAQARALWNPMAQAFFEGGPTDPHLRVLWVQPERLELWEPQGSKLGQLVKVLARAAGANIDADELGRHAVLERAEALPRL